MKIVTCMSSSVFLILNFVRKKVIKFGEKDTRPLERLYVFLAVAVALSSFYLSGCMHAGVCIKPEQVFFKYRSSSNTSTVGFSK